MDEVQRGSRPNSAMSEVETLVDSVKSGSEPTGSGSLISRPMATKRLRRETCFESDGFTLVTRNKKQNNNKIIKEKFEVGVSSHSLLPKQIGLAKLLKSENIDNAVQIKYKTPYRVNILFEKREDAEKILRNEKLVKLGYRCHLTSEVAVSYGIVKYVELEVEEEEILKAFQCEHNIVSVRRLKRIDVSGEWVNSETVRFGFKGPNIPQYVFGYDCRFKVEPYTFPVTQCSSCWKFGHTTRTCPSKRVVCPKCAEEHANCETSYYLCVNCKGTHMALDKSCPIFARERKIRSIMSQDNCTYKIALLKLVQNKRVENYEYNMETPQLRRMHDKVINTPLSYSQSVGARIVQAEAVIHQEDVISEEDSSEPSIESILEIGQTKRRKIKKKNPKKNLKTQKDNEKAKKSVPLLRDNDEEISKENKFHNILRKLKEIVFSEKNFEAKVQEVLKLLIQEFVSFIVKSVNHGEVFTKLIGLFING